MMYRIRQGFSRAFFWNRVRRVFSTPPVMTNGEDRAPALVSQLCHRDLAMYLLAVKSFARFVPLRSVFALDDGSLTARDRAILDAHIPGIQILPISLFRAASCPRGGTWERLLFIADEVQRGYVIQLDADTLTLECPIEVREAIQGSRSFTLGTNDGREFVAVAAAAATGREYASLRPDHPHVQAVAESLLDRLPMADRLRYVRGCSGFAGFAGQSFGRAAVEQFSREMATLLGGRRWEEWGTEQVTSNYLIANSPSSLVLPVPEYNTFDSSCDLALSKFVHFIGTYRFRRGIYAYLSRTVIRELK